MIMIGETISMIPFCYIVNKCIEPNLFYRFLCLSSKPNC